MQTSYRGVKPLIEIARDFINGCQQYAKCVENKLFTEEDLAVHFALGKAQREYLDSIPFNQPVNLDDAREQARYNLADRLSIPADEVVNILAKVNNSLK